MLILLHILFWLAIYLVVHSYVVFPWQMKRAGRQPQVFSPVTDNQPTVAILLAAYNEAAVMEEKILSTLNTSYPHEKLEIWIGSDCSTDRTDEIVQQFALRYPQVHGIRFESRTGKPQIINALRKKTTAEILVLTDADTFFLKDTIAALTAPFSDPFTGGVQARFRSRVAGRPDVARQELMYNDREVMIKAGQSRYGAVIGAYGACYAIRASLYEPVPAGFVVDDFYIFMKVLEKQYRTVLAEQAVCHLEVSGQSDVEFRRKVRIGSGNFQNFFSLRYFWSPFRSFAHYAYWSHKVLRWFTPFLLIAILVLNAVLAWELPGYRVLLAAQAVGYLLVGIDLASGRSRYTSLFRFASHFVLMNAALLAGFFRFLKGSGTSSWSNKA